MDITWGRAGLEWDRAGTEGEGRRKEGGDFIVISWKGVVISAWLAPMTGFLSFR